MEMLLTHPLALGDNSDETPKFLTTKREQCPAEDWKTLLKMEDGIMIIETYGDHKAGKFV